LSSANFPGIDARLSATLYWCGLVLIGAAVISGLIAPALTLARFVPLDPNEGWNAFFSQIAMHGGSLYPEPAGSPIINVYPPLSFYVVGVVGQLIGDNIFAGRSVALLSMLIVGCNVYLWLRASGSTNRIAWLGAGVFAAFAVTYARSYAGINDPQWFGHALMTSGLVIMWRGNASTRAIALGALLVIAGGWSKHSIVALPIATTWWLLQRSGWALMTWIACCAVLMTAAAILVWKLYGIAFVHSLLFARQYSMHQAIKDTRTAFKCLAPIIALSLLLLPRARGSQKTEFAIVYLLVATVVAAAASGGIGIDINKYFDLMISASLCAALSVESLWATRLPWLRRFVEFGPAMTAILGVYLAAYAASLMPSTIRFLETLHAREQQTLADISVVSRSGHGRAACETMELCYWGKSEFTVDLFDFGQRLLVGSEPLTTCADLFDGRHILLLQLFPHSDGASEQLPSACNAVIRQNYRLTYQSTSGEFLTPGG
jgi:hypothetical protein